MRANTMLQLALLGALTARAAGDCACTDFAMPAMSSRGVHGGYLGETDQEILGRLHLTGRQLRRLGFARGAVGLRLDRGERTARRRAVERLRGLRRVVSFGSS